MLVNSLSPRGARWRVRSSAPSLTAHFRQLAARRAGAPRRSPSRRRLAGRGASAFWRRGAVAGPRSARLRWLEFGTIYGLGALALTLGALGVIGLAH